MKGRNFKKKTWENGIIQIATILLNCGDLNYSVNTLYI